MVAIMSAFHEFQQCYGLLLTKKINIQAYLNDFPEVAENSVGFQKW